VQDTLYIESKSEGSEYDIVSLEGKVLISFVLDSSPYAVDVSHLPVGIYILRSVNNNSSIKFIKE
jgi:hypothetical protein